MHYGKTPGIDLATLMLAAFAALVAGCATTSAPPAEDTDCEVPAEAAATGGQADPAASTNAAAVPGDNLSKLRVGVYADNGASGIGAMEWLRIVDDSPEMELRIITAQNVGDGALDGVDVCVMPGGRSRQEYSSLGTNGVERMKAFIRGGGAYLGTCAGCCLLMDGPKERARVIPWNTKGAIYSTLMLPVNVNDAGAKALGISKGTHTMRYHGGPFLWPTTNRIDGADFAVWGTFDSEATSQGRLSAGTKMFGAAAIVAGTYGKGRVFATSFHPEYFDSTRYIVAGAFHWLTGREVTFPVRQRKRGAISVGVLQGAGVAGAKAVLAINAADDMDMVPVDSGAILQGALEHIDVLVACGPKISGSKRAMDAISDFCARGGRILALPPARAVLPKGEENSVCANAEKLLAAIRQIK